MYNRQLIDAMVKKDEKKVAEIRAQQKEHHANMNAIKTSYELEGRGEENINRISDLVGQLLKLEPIKKALENVINR